MQHDPIPAVTAPPSPRRAGSPSAACSALIVLGLAWELWLAPLRPGRPLLALKVLPLCIPLAGLLRNRMYTYRWVSLLVWLYFMEGVVRATSERGTAPLAARSPRSLLCLVPVRRLRAARAAAPAKAATMNALIDQLRAIVGAANVLTEGDLSAWEQDWRKRVAGKALAVVRPGIDRRSGGGREGLRRCGRAPSCRRAATPAWSVGSMPDASGTQVRAEPAAHERACARIDAANLTMTVEAGCVLQALQEAAEAAGLLFPLSLAAEGSCTIGGNLATNAGGTQVRALRQRARAVPGAGSGDRARRGLGRPDRACARTTPATTCATCSSAAKARWASSPPRR